MRLFLFLLSLLISLPSFSEVIMTRNRFGGWTPAQPQTFNLKNPAARTSLKTGNLLTTVTYADVNERTGIGFDDPLLGPNRRATFAAVLDYIGKSIENTGGLDIFVDQSETDGTGSIASAGPIFRLAQGFVDVYPLLHITTGVDPNFDFPDLTVSFVDFGYKLHTGSSQPASDAFDLHSILLHELTHGLGMISFSDAEGRGIDTGNGGQAFSPFDGLLQTGEGTQLWTASGFAGTPTSLTGGQGGVYFQGEAAGLSYNGPIPVHTPSTFVPESSLDHWSSNVNASVMAPELNAGTTRRSYSSFELATLADLGYAAKTEYHLVFPWVSNSTEFESTLIVNNPSTTVASFQLTARRADGSSEFTEPIELTPGAFLQRRAADLFPQLGVGSGYTVTLTSDSAQLTGRWITFDKVNFSPSQGEASQITEGFSESQGTALMYGYLPGNTDFQSAAVVVNVDEAPADITVYFYSQAGTLLQTLLFSNLPPRTPKVLAVIDAAATDQYAVVTSTGSYLQGAIFVFNSRGQTAIGKATALSSYTPPN